MEAWTELMNGGPLRARPEPEGQRLTLDGLEQRLRIVAPQRAELARRIQAEGRLDERWNFREEPLIQCTYGGAIVHVVTHSMHHRAQLIHMLKRLGVPDVIEGDALSWEEAREREHGP